MICCKMLAGTNYYFYFIHSCSSQGLEFEYSKLLAGIHLIYFLLITPGLFFQTVSLFRETGLLFVFVFRKLIATIFQHLNAMSCTPSTLCGTFLIKLANPFLGFAPRLPRRKVNSAFHFSRSFSLSRLLFEPKN